MRYVACQNGECVNKGAPYTVDDTPLVVYPCPVCGTAMVVIDAPDLEPPAAPVDAAEAPPTDQELTDAARQQKAATVYLLLADSDKWAARAVEEAAPMDPSRVAYRKALRATLTQLGKAATVADVDAVAIPKLTPQATLNGAYVAPTKAP